MKRIRTVESPEQPREPFGGRLQDIVGPLRRAAARRRLVVAARTDASAPRTASPLAQLVSQILLAVLVFASVFTLVYAWVANVAWAMTAGIIATGLTRAAVERAEATNVGQRRRRARIQRALRETEKMLVRAGADDFLAALTRCLARLDYERPQIMTGFGPGGEGMVIANNGEQRIAVYYIVDSGAVLDADAVVIAAAELARIDCARHFFATTGEFTPAAYRRAERVGVTLIDRYELVGLFAADQMRAAVAEEGDPAGAPHWSSEPASVRTSIEQNEARIAGHWRMALLLALLALLNWGATQIYLLALVAVNTIMLVYRQWLNFRLLAMTGSELPEMRLPDSPFGGK